MFVYEAHTLINLYILNHVPDWIWDFASGLMEFTNHWSETHWYMVPRKFIITISKNWSSVLSSLNLPLRNEKFS